MIKDNYAYIRYLVTIYRCYFSVYYYITRTFMMFKLVKQLNLIV